MEFLDLINTIALIQIEKENESDLNIYVDLNSSTSSTSTESIITQTTKMTRLRINFMLRHFPRKEYYMNEINIYHKNKYRNLKNSIDYISIPKNSIKKIFRNEIMLKSKESKENKRINESKRRKVRIGKRRNKLIKIIKQ